MECATMTHKIHTANSLLICIFANVYFLLPINYFKVDFFC